VNIFKLFVINLNWRHVVMGSGNANFLIIPSWIVSAFGLLCCDGLRGCEIFDHPTSDC
jgi:hypothetical protein